MDRMTLIYCSKQRRVRETLNMVDFIDSSGYRFYTGRIFFRAAWDLVFSRLDESLLLVNSDREFDSSMILIFLARILNIKTGLILPDNAAGKESCISLRKPIKPKGLLFSITNSIYPENYVEEDGKFYSYYAKWNLLLVCLFPYRSIFPWYEGFGATSIIYHRFKLFDDYLPMLIKKGVELHKVLDESSLTVLSNKDEVPNKEVILSLPQFWEQGFFSKKKAYDEHQKIIEYLLKRFRTVHISLHPRMNPDEYSFLTSNENIKIIDKPIYEVIHEYGCLACLNSSILYYLDIIDRDLIIFKYINMSYQGLDRFMNRENSTVILMQ